MEADPMHNVTALLLSSDSSLIESCQQLIDSIAKLRPLVLTLHENLDTYLEREELGLIVIHVIDQGDAEEAARLLQKIASLQRPVAVIVLGDWHDPQLALSLLRQGAADFLSRPVDLGRLAY